ncbi:MAG TPA: tRNA preQ1(34) S-adenosylmethionine ribosyltransferase-isomerase QueA [Lentisphaeria bacterium]|nr:MAG: tRNA preQ1(34) S-adenosylmethionine ribosyltransferase-isomerase QueA [Lentisphaerae bacterium GWF2_50_93]HCE44995.1 tRNA preQ1(34) S-adenosylmethionine ribosyltransferase-isomerase QueA [Lentisphaeria bacterium]
MRLAQFDYHLPEELIAQFPPENRGGSRMLVMDRTSGGCEIRSFSCIADYLEEGDCVVINNTKVINARIFGRKNGDGAKVEILFLRRVDDRSWTCFLKPGKRMRVGTRIKVSTPDGKELWVIIVERTDDGIFTVASEDVSIAEIQELAGHVPLPPYIRRDDLRSDAKRYQTVFAKEEGAVAAPTAGLHFTDEIFAEFAARGASVAELTLHVGPGTFLPVSCDRIEDHAMHSEFFLLPREAEEKINRTKMNGKKILAVGTTTVRVLETCANEDGTVRAGTGDTSIFLYPPYRPKVPDMLLTNFHLPKSTLLMLVSTFSSLDNVMNAYSLAIDSKMKFFSYGDCMLLK